MVSIRSVVRRGFTLVELLVVISIMSVLITLLLPSLKDARRLAQNTKCSASMRSGLVAVLAYRNDYSFGLTNYDRYCQYFGQGWAGGTTGAHYLSTVDSQGNTYGHMNNEYFDVESAWCAYVLKGGYAGVLDASNPASPVVRSATGLGCSFTDFRAASFGWFGPDTSLGSNYWGGNWLEGSQAGVSTSILKDPCFIWLGPGAASYARVDYFYTIRLDTTGWASTTISSGGTSFWDASRKPLLGCPVVAQWGIPGNQYGGPGKLWVPTHRPEWTTLAPSTNLGYSRNLGYTDGSVRWFENAAWGTGIDPYQ